MENTNQAVIDKLNHLIDIAEDGKYGYENAAKDVTDDKVRSLFSHYADERKVYIRILQDQIMALGGEIKISEGGPVGSIHRTWMDFKSLITGGDRDPILNICITGEESAINAYKKALDNSYITGTTKDIIAGQCVGIENALSKIKAYLKDESV
jgi:uncharacterized protein (TIGR02284 family)